MEGKSYLKKFDAVKSLGEREALLARAKALENEDRALFARQRESWQVPELDNPYKGLVPVFEEEEKGGGTLFQTRKYFEEEESIPRLFDVGKEARKQRRKEPITVPNLGKFREQFMNVFSNNILQFLNWDNVVAAGGAVSGCVVPIPEEHAQSMIQKRKYYHDIAYSSSDIDLFLYALSPKDANAKLMEIYDSICAACPFEVICFRSAHAVTMVSQYPYRHVQVVLRIYNSPYEVLAGFDVDSCTFLYDGEQVYTTPRGHHALATGCNTIDLSRRSPSYEVRLAKYANRGFEVLVPTFQRDKVDPNIFDKPWGVLRGLQKLVVLETLRSAQARLEYQTRHQKESGLRSRLQHRNVARKQLERLEKAQGGSDESNYATVFLPWGEGFTARKVLKLMRKKDIVLNSGWFRKGREYFLHPCFFGTAQEVLQDCSPEDPPIPDDVTEKDLRSYVRGPLKWLEDDPGRQQVGSFNPITDQDWEAGAYFLGVVGEINEAVNKNDVEALKGLMDQLGPSWDPFMRDYLGRSPLHVGLMAGATETCNVLLDNDAVDPTLRLPDGRNALHLIAEYNRPEVLSSLLKAVKRSQAAREAYEAKSKQEKDEMDANGVLPPRDISLEEFVELKTFDNKWTALQLAVLLGRVDVVQVLLEDFGADCKEHLKLPQPQADTRMYYYGQQSITKRGLSLDEIPVALLIPPDRAVAERLVGLLLDHGLNSLEDFVIGDGGMCVLHVLAALGNMLLLELLVEGLESRGHGEIVSSLLRFLDNNDRTPLVMAVQTGNLDCAKYLYNRFPHLEIPTKLKEAHQLLLSKSVRSNRGRFGGYYYNYNNSDSIPEFKLDRDIVFAAVERLVAAWVELYRATDLAQMTYRRFPYGMGSQQNDGSFARYNDEPERKGVFAEKDDDDDDDGDTEEVSAQKSEVLRSRVDESLELLTWVLDVAQTDKTTSYLEKKYEGVVSFANRSLDPNNNRGYGYSFFGSRNTQEVAKQTIRGVLKSLMKALCKGAYAWFQDKDDETGSSTSKRAAKQKKELAALLEKYEEGTYEHRLVSCYQTKQNASIGSLHYYNYNPYPPSGVSKKKKENVLLMIGRVSGLIDLLGLVKKARKGEPVFSTSTSPKAKASPSRRLSAALNKSLSRSSGRKDLESALTFLSSGLSDTMRAALLKDINVLGVPEKENEGKVAYDNVEDEEDPNQSMFSRLLQTFAVLSVQAASDMQTLRENSFFDWLGILDTHRSTPIKDENGRLLGLFRAAFEGDIDTVLAELGSDGWEYSPFLLVDSAGVSLVALLLERCSENRGQLARTIYKMALEKYEPPKKLAEKGSPRNKNQRIDNVKLLNAEGSEDEDGSHDEDESDDDDDDAGADLAFSNDLDAFADGKEMMKKKHAFADASAAKSDAIRFNPAWLFFSTIYMSKTHVLKDVPEIIYKQAFPSDSDNETTYTLDLARYAIVEGDADLLEAILEIRSNITSKEYVLGDAATIGGALDVLCVVLGRIECLKVMIRTVGGCVAWSRIAKAIRLLSAFKVKVHKKYQGMKTVLDQGKSSSSSRNVVEYPFPTSWTETSALLGNGETLSWLLDNTSVVADLFDEFLASSGNNAAAKLGAFAAEGLERLENGQLDSLSDIPKFVLPKPTRGGFLAALVCCANPHDLTHVNGTGKTLLYLSLSTSNRGAIDALVARAPHLLLEPCKVPPSNKTSEDGQGDEDEDSGEKLLPIHLAASRVDLSALRIFLNHGADVFSKGAGGKNIIHFVANALQSPQSAVWLEETFRIVEESVGRNALAKLVTMKDDAGLDCFHLVFSKWPVEVLEQLLGSFLSPEMLEGEQERGGLLNVFLQSTDPLNSSQFSKLELLLGLSGKDQLATVEDSTGATAVDHVLSKIKNSVDPSLFGVGHGDLVKSPSNLPLSSHPLFDKLQEVTAGHTPRHLATFELVQERVFRQAKDTDARFSDSDAYRFNRRYMYYYRNMTVERLTFQVFSHILS